ncbi:hypothetical protein [Candidatus Uabimicrobium sp. HlEnr_7]|uniref:hypothetical protein n=1 Tax=Candidatus Uabimicrobium helgolandensis TaxID=3095367 RepID=UPI003558F26B
MKSSNMLLTVAGFFFINALLYNYFTLVFFSARYFPFIDLSEHKYSILFIQFTYFSLCVLFVFLSFYAKKYCNEKKKIIYVPCFFLLSILALAALCELALIPFIDLTPIYTTDAKRGWKLKANSKGSILGTKYSINAKGVRGKEIDYEPNLKYRILYLGDSVMFGFMIEKDANTLPYKIEQCLGDRGLTVETINAGVCGYSPSQEYEYLINEGIKYHPNLVVVSVVLNDVSDKMFFKNMGDNIVGFELLSQKKISSRLELLLQMLYTNKTKRRNYFSVNRELCDFPQHQKFAQYLEKTFEELQKIDLFCKKRSIKTLFVFFPCRYQLTKNTLAISPQKKLQKEFQYLDLQHVFFQATLQQQISTYYLDFWHPTVQGYQLAAEKITQYLEQEIPSEYFNK